MIFAERPFSFKEKDRMRMEFHSFPDEREEMAERKIVDSYVKQ
jgi:hypothetical protein